MHIVLFQPEIPGNTGTIGRSCYLTHSTLHLIRPLGFQIDDKKALRAGLDYWPHLDLHVYDSFDDFVAQNNPSILYMCETKTSNLYTDMVYVPNPYIMFGRETTGIPDEILADHKETAIRIPMIPDSRSLNLSNTVSIVMYEVLRQQGFPGLI